MTKLKSPNARTSSENGLVETIEQQSAELRLLRQEVAEWRKRYEAGELRDIGFNNSEKEVAPIYTPLDAAETSAEALGMPGVYPYTRGVHATGYRGRLWTMRQFAGFGSARDTNERYKFLLAHGQTGLSVAFDFPTLMGYDSDHPRSEGEVGKCGVAISSLADMEMLFDGIPLDQVSTSMTINGPAVILYCFYIAAAEKQGVDSRKLRGTIQNDILKEYMAQHAWVYPIEPALRLIVDCFEWSAEHVPQWNTISISGYHIREAGATAAQELAFTLADGFTYVERGIARGLDVDTFA
ncbi:MAG: methylmalonyl-CoA mutase family protein, partial [Gemmatimonadaceae bacterium]